MAEVTATQTRRPWSAVLRTSVAALLGLLPILPLIAEALHVETVPIVASTLAVTAAVTRVLAVPAVERWLRRWAPAFAADTYTPPTQERENDQDYPDAHRGRTRPGDTR